MTHKKTAIIEICDKCERGIMHDTGEIKVCTLCGNEENSNNNNLIWMKKITI